MTPATAGPPNGEVPARRPEPAPTTTPIVDTAKHNGYDPNSLRAALESFGASLKDWTVMSK